MEVKVIKVHNTEDSINWSVKFEAQVGEIVLTGIASNYFFPKKIRIKENRDYGIRLTFDQPGISKHKNYSEIRGKIITQIFERDDMLYFKMGAGL